MNAEIERIPKIDFTVKAASLEDDLFSLYSQLFPGVTKADLTFKELTGGFVNSIWRLESFLNFLAYFKLKSLPNNSKSSAPLKFILSFRLSTKKGAKDRRSLIFRTFGVKFDEEEFNKNFTLDTKTNGENKENAEKNELTNGEAKKSDLPTESDFSRMLFNRLAEYKVMHVVSKQGLCQPVHATYNNGIVYGCESL